MHEWLSDAVERVRKTSRGGALPDKGIALEAPEEVETLEEGAGKGLLLKSVTMIEYTLIIACISLVIAVAGPPVAEAVQGQFTKVANVISNGSTGGTGGGSDFPGGGSGGGSGSDQGGTDDKTDSDGDGIPDSQDKYPNDPNNGAGGNQGGSDGDSGNTGDDGSDAKEALAGTISLGDCVVGLTSAPAPDGAVQSDASLSYTWYVNGTEVSNNPYYTFIPAEQNAKAYVCAIDSSGKYTGQIKSNTATVSSRDLTSLMVVELPKAHAEQKCSAVISGRPVDANLTYTWTVDNYLIESNPTDSYTPTSDQIGKTLKVTVKDANGIYSGSVSAESVIGGKVLPKLSGSISISDCTVGLSSSAVVNEVPNDAELEITWYINNTATEKGASKTFKASDKNATVFVAAIDKSGKYEGKITSSITRVGIRQITGSVNIAEPIVGKPVKANISGAPTDIDPVYNWVVDGTNSQSTITYTPQSSGEVIYVEVQDRNQNYSGTLCSPVYVAKDDSGDIDSNVLTGSVAIGSCTVGLESNAHTSNVPDDAEIAYEWYNGTDKIGNGISHSFGIADLNKEVRVAIHDNSGKYTGVIWSNVTRVESRIITGSVTFNEPVANSKLTAITSGFPSDMTSSMKYSWKLNGKVVSSASTYTPRASSVGQTLCLEISDSRGFYAGTIISESKVVLAKSVSNPDIGLGGGVIGRFSSTTTTNDGSCTMTVTGYSPEYQTPYSYLETDITTSGASQKYIHFAKAGTYKLKFSAGIKGNDRYLNGVDMQLREKDSKSKIANYELEAKGFGSGATSAEITFKIPKDDFSMYIYLSSSHYFGLSRIYLEFSVVSLS